MESSRAFFKSPLQRLLRHILRAAMSVMYSIGMALRPRLSLGFSVGTSGVSECVVIFLVRFGVFLCVGVSERSFLVVFPMVVRSYAIESDLVNGAK